MKKIRAILYLVLLVHCAAAIGQDAQEPTDEETVSTESDAERVARLERIVQSEKARISELAQDLIMRAAEFERVSAEVARRGKELAELRDRLESITDANEVAILNEEIAAAEEKYELTKRYADLALQAEKSVRGQIRTLEQKIEIDKEALDVALGKVDLPQVPAVADDGSATGESPSKTPTEAAGVPGAIPGVPSVPASGTSDVIKEILPDTPEQIEARKQAARSELEAELAERAVLTFLERKAALQQQIDLEQSLLDTALQSREIADEAILIRQRELEAAEETGDEVKIELANQKLERIIDSWQRIDAEITSREETLEGFGKRMDALHEEQQMVTLEAEQKREQASTAQRQSIWLNSPLHPSNIIRWGINRGPNIIAVLIVVAIVLVAIRHSVQRIARTMVGKGRRSRRNVNTRADTLALSFGSAANVIIIVIGLFLILEAGGVDITTVLGGAAVLGVAIAFGAQNLMRDYFNGFIILIEDQYELNDLVTIGDITGRVESVSLRTTSLRDLKGKLHFIPNGEIKAVTNRSYEWARIVFDIRVAYKESADQVIAEVLAVAQEVCADEKFKDGVIEPPQMLGVDKFTEFGMIIKCLLKVSPSHLFEIRREVLRRIKNRFDELGIEIPMVDAAALPGRS